MMFTYGDTSLPHICFNDDDVDGRPFGIVDPGRGETTFFTLAEARNLLEAGVDAVGVYERTVEARYVLLCVMKQRQDGVDLEVGYWNEEDSTWGDHVEAEQYNLKDAQRLVKRRFDSMPGMKVTIVPVSFAKTLVG